MPAHKKNMVPASQAKKYTICTQDLPLSCPMPNMTLWNAHPRVFLPIEKTGEASCPYCGATYVLTDFQKEK